MILLNSSCCLLLPQVRLQVSTLPGAAPQVMYKQNFPHHLSAPVHIWRNQKQLHLDEADCVTTSWAQFTFYSPLQRNQGTVGQQGGAGTKQSVGTCHLKSSSTKSTLSSSQFLDSQSENKWAHPLSSPRAEGFSHCTAQVLAKQGVLLQTSSHNTKVQILPNSQMTSDFL